MDSTRTRRLLIFLPSWIKAVTVQDVPGEGDQFSALLNATQMQPWPYSK